MVNILLRLYTKSIKRNAEKYSVQALVMYTVAGLFFLAITPYMALNLYYSAYMMDEVFPTLEPERVVKQWIVHSNEYGDTQVELVTESGVHLSRGIHTPGYADLKMAVEEQRPLKVWWHVFEFKPRFLAKIAKVNKPSLFQVSDDTKTIISHSAMTKHRQDGYYIIIIFVVLLAGLVVLLPVIAGAAIVKLKRRKKAIHNMGGST